MFSGGRASARPFQGARVISLGLESDLPLCAQPLFCFVSVSSYVLGTLSILLTRRCFSGGIHFWIERLQRGSDWLGTVTYLALSDRRSSYRELASDYK